MQKFFLVEVVFVTVVPRSSCCGSSSAGEFFVFLCNAASIALDLQKLIGALSYPSPVTSTASSSWSPQLADSLTRLCFEQSETPFPIVSSIQRNAPSHVSSSVPGVSASEAPQPLFSSASAPSTSTSDGVSSVA